MGGVHRVARFGAADGITDGVLRHQGLGRSRLMATAGGGAVATWLGGQDLPFRIWDSKRRRWWGDLYQHCPDDLLGELNGEADYQKITALLKRYRAEKR